MSGFAFNLNANLCETILRLARDNIKSSKTKHKIISMISRRHLLSILGHLGVGSFLLKYTSAQNKTKSSSSEGENNLPPHCEALTLVWNSQQKLIREVEIEYAKAQQTKQKEYVSAETRWWFDTEKRNWEVNRPTPPGGIDTTHEFVVSYLINGKVAVKWSVNTEVKQVDVLKQ